MPRKKQSESWAVVRDLTGSGRVSSKGWVVIPKEIRDELDIKPGDELQFAIVPPLPNMKQDLRLTSINIIKVPKTMKERLELTYGMFKRRPGDRPMTQILVEERRKEAAAEERKIRPSQRRRPRTA